MQEKVYADGMGDGCAEEETERQGGARKRPGCLEATGHAHRTHNT